MPDDDDLQGLASLDRSLPAESLRLDRAREDATAKEMESRGSIEDSVLTTYWWIQDGPLVAVN